MNNIDLFIKFITTGSKPRYDIINDQLVITLEELTLDKHYDSMNIEDAYYAPNGAKDIYKVVDLYKSLFDMFDLKVTLERNQEYIPRDNYLKIILDHTMIKPLVHKNIYHTIINLLSIVCGIKSEVTTRYGYLVEAKNRVAFIGSTGINLHNDMVSYNLANGTLRQHYKENPGPFGGGIITEPFDDVKSPFFKNIITACARNKSFDDVNRPYA